MKPRTLVVTGALAAFAAGLFHLNTLGSVRQIDARLAHTAAGLVSVRIQLDTTDGEIAAVREQLRRISQSPPPIIPPSETHRDSTAGIPPPRSRLSMVADDPELRRLRVQSYVSEQHLLFGGLLKQLGFTPEQTRRFDEIQAEYQQAMLDIAGAANSQSLEPNDPSLANLRKQVTQTQETQLHDLFGTAYDQWGKANRSLSSRTIVSQIVQQTFQGPAPLTGPQAEQLTQVLENNRVQTPSGQSTSTHSRYNWEAIAADAQSILTPKQRDGFTTALNLYRTSTQMSAISTTTGH